MLIRFGDIFSKERVGKGKSFVRKIASGVKISDLITHNMEAFMRTVLSVGCSHDWPNYLKSDKYQEWNAKKSKVEVIEIDDVSNDENDGDDNDKDKDDEAKSVDDGKGCDDDNDDDNGDDDDDGGDKGGNKVETEMAKEDGVNDNGTENETEDRGGK